MADNVFNERDIPVYFLQVSYCLRTARQTFQKFLNCVSNNKPGSL